MWNQRGVGNGEKRDDYVAVAIDKDKSSQYALKWAIDHLLSKGQTVTLLHVKQRPSSIPTPMGSHVSISDVNDGVAKAYKAQLEQQAKEVFLPFRAFCTRKDIKTNEITIEDADISKALCDYVRTNLVENMVVGSPTKYSFVRFKSSDIPTNVSKGAPEFCSVYIITKGKISSVRSATIPVPNPPPRPVQYQNNPPPTSSVDSRLLPNFSSKAIERSSARNPMEDTEIKSPFQRNRGTTNRSYGGDLAIDSDISFVNSGRPSFDHRAHNAPPFDNQDLSVGPPRLSYGSYGENRPSFGSPSKSELDFMHGFSSGSTESASASWQASPNMDDVEAEMRRLKQELKQTMDMYSTACKEALTAKQTAMELNRWKMEEQRRFEEARLAEEAALALAEKEKAKTKAAIEAAETAQRIAELEAQKRMNAEMKAKKETEEKNKVLNVLAKSDNRYRKYSIEEIEIATDQFSDSRKIGEGGYGPVYKGYLDHTPVAIKVLRPDAAQGRSQFQQEVEVLSCIRHPNMVLLLGACPEYGCLVYEYMSNGSLEDCLFRKGKVQVLPWQVRFRIAAEIGTGLLFLHQAKPEPLVHRDLKPANILLDRNYVSKISDVGLARLVPPSIANSVTQYHMTSAAGTFCYIDPEYQQTGMLGIKSDIYSLGIMLLQIITAKPPMGLTHQVERAIEKNTFAEVLDPAVPDWPVEEALGFAKLALQCAELRRKDRPDLKTVVLPELNRLRILGEESMPSSNLMFQAIVTPGTSPAPSQGSAASQDLISDPLMRHRSSQSPLSPNYISREED